MCGICGWLGHELTDEDAEVANRMVSTLRHRGPDGEGAVAVEGGGLRGWIGHRRLRIVDLSEAARQPMASDDGQVVLTYNGEIYNFRELRRELEGAGHRFRSSGDSEVVLRAYEQWGASFPARLDGMFAFAVWDGRLGRLLLARDRTGKKPLFYSTAGGRVTFGSEVKAILAAPWVRAVPDTTRLAEFLTYGYVAAPHTLLRDVRQLPPATVALFDRDGESGPTEYWDCLPAAAAGEPGISGTDARARIPVLLEAAVRRRMVADVPLGALLSGGIDSSLIVALMTRHSPEQVRTFCVGFADDASFDERDWARRVASRLGTRHAERVVRVDAVGLLDDLLWHHDFPFADSSAIPTYLACRLAREEVTVVLTGDGGDEVFGGYERFTAARLAQLAPPLAAETALRALRRLRPDDSYHSNLRRLQRFLEDAGAPVEQRYRRWTSVLSPEVLQAVRPCDGFDDPAERWLPRAAGAAPLDRLLYLNFKTYLPEDLNVKLDRTSMAVSLEARSPFLDTALVECLSRVPARDKVGLRRTKPLLRRAFGDILPREVWNRPKHGFGVPMNSWFRGSLGVLFADEVLAPSARTADYLSREAVAALLFEHRAGTASHGPALWSLLTLERWLRAAERPAARRSAVAEPFSG